MEKLLNPSDNSALTRDAIIGLGESSYRKSYYPTLQKKVSDLELLNSKYRTLIETMPDVLITSSAEGFSVYSPEGQLTLMAKDLLRDETISAFLKGSVAASRAENQLITRNFAFKSRGKQFFLEARVNIIGAEDALIVIRDMTQEVLSKTKLSEMARQDVMTKLANRRCFEESLSKYTGKYCEKLTVIMLDIDGLKIINDTYGHPVGDQLIIAMSNILRDTFVDSECIARVGGDEFTILLVGKEQTEVELLFKEMK